MRKQTLFRPKVILLFSLAILVTASSSLFFFTCLDHIVQSDLYGYGLQFSYEWADRYWNYSKLIFGSLAVVIPIACASIALTIPQVRGRKINSPKLVLSFFLVVEIIMIALSLFFFTCLDHIVHSDLYGYGLQFSYEWADRYWNYSKLILGSLVTAIGISCISVVLINISATALKIKLSPSLTASFKTNLTKLICCFLTSGGVIALAFSINYNSSILAFIGLGLIFWGVILLYIRPENCVKETLFNKTTLPLLTDLDQIITELDLKGKGVYLPPKYFKGFESSKVYISKQGDLKLPPPEKTQSEEDKMFIQNPNGALITPPGIELKRLFEKTLSTSFTRVDLQYLEQNIPKLLVEDLEIAQDAEIKTENDRVFVEIKNSIYQSICKEAKKLSNIYCSLGCPLCSAIACALAEATGKSVVIKQHQIGDDGQTAGIEYCLLESKEDQKQK